MLSDQRKGLSKGRKLRRTPARNTLIKDRLQDASAWRAAPPDELYFQHTVMCQTYMPRVSQGDNRVWTHDQGRAHLHMASKVIFDYRRSKWVYVPLPFGTKARQVLMYPTHQAVKTKNPKIDPGRSLSAFCKRLGIGDDRRAHRVIKTQLGALAATHMELAIEYPDDVIQRTISVVDKFELWLPNDREQLTLWPTTVELSPGYFESLLNHAVPLDERAIRTLSHSAVALDIYVWLAERLHRIRENEVHRVGWHPLKEQFGREYKQMRAFRNKFMIALRQVYAVYPEMNIDVGDRGVELFASPPPVAKKRVIVTLPATPTSIAK